MKKFILVFSLVVCSAVIAAAQPKIFEKKAEKAESAALAPVTFKAKYEGGMFGFSKKEEGTLKFDDANLRLVFFDKDNKEKFGIPYDALAVIYPNTDSVQSNTGKVVQYIPYVGLAGQFMKKKRRYLVVNFDDRDIDVKGTMSFKLETAELLESVIQTLGSKAEMQSRGDAYYRPAKKEVKDDQ